MNDRRASSLTSIPNLLSISRLPLALVFAWALYVGDATWLAIGFLVALVAMITDGLDGWAARKMGLVSDFGKLFDPLADAIFFVIAFVGFALGELIPWWLAMPFVVRELLQHLWLRPLAKKRGLAMGAKLIGKLKTVTQAVVVLAVVAIEWARITPAIRDALGLGEDQSGYLLAYGIMCGIAASLSVGSIVPYIITVASLKQQANESPAPTVEE